MAQSTAERGRELARRRTDADQRARRRVERGIQRCRAWALAVTVAQAVLDPASTTPVVRWGPVVLLALVCAASQVALARDRGLTVLRRAGALGMAGDSVVVVALLATMSAQPGHPVGLLPVVLAAEAAVRWGRAGGLAGGLGAAAVTGVWTIAVQLRVDEPLAAGPTVFRMGVVALVGVLMGSTVGAIRRERRLAETVIAASSDLIASIDLRTGRIRSVNRASTTILGRTPDELVGRPGADLLAGDATTDDATGGPGGDSFRRLDPGLVELPAVHADGHPVWLEIDIQPDRGEGVVYLMARDVTARRRGEAEARRRLDDESATGAANRAHLVARLARELKGPRRCHLLAIDLGGLSEATSALDPRLAESVLVAAVGRVRAAVRPDDLVARLGGDELAVLLPAPTSEYEAADAAHRITAALLRPLAAAGGTVQLGPRVGVAASHPSDRPLDLTARAEAAMSEVARDRHRSVVAGHPSAVPSAGPVVGGLAGGRDVPQDRAAVAEGGAVVPQPLTDVPLSPGGRLPAVPRPADGAPPRLPPSPS